MPRPLTSACLIAGALPLIVTATARGAFVSEDFTTDPGWTGVNNTTGQQNYGYSGGTNFAGGATGEAGGTTGRDAFSSFYGDTTSIPVALTLNDPAQASGRFIIKSPSTWDHGIEIGHFRETDVGDFVGLVIAEPAGAFTQSRVRAIVQRDNGSNTIAATPQVNLSRETPHTFSYLWDPTGGSTGQGLLTLFLDGVPLDSEDVGGVFNLAERTGSTPLVAFDTWGMAVPGVSFATSTVQVFIDDVSFNIDAVIPEPASAALLVGGALMLTRRKRSDD